jgi:hypothetical protein
MTPAKGRQYIVVDLPDRFILEVPGGSGWIEHGRYEADAFQRQPDGGYLCAGHGGSPTYLRASTSETPRSTWSTSKTGPRPSVWSHCPDQTRPDQ